MTARRWRPLVLLLMAMPAAILLATNLPALAQQRPRSPPAAQPATPPPAPEPPPPPYEPPMLRLAEIMGALSFLEDLCQTGDGARWQERMQALIETEDASPARRERLAGAFNRGFSGFSDIYRTCTPSARQAMERYTREGATLAADIANRYGG
ncbi:MAG: TIGR02301 family protein [Beijerinckiaceae bacterium]